MNDQQRMSLVANALFTHDAASRMVRVNEPDGDVAPRFFLGRTRDGHVWRFRTDLPDDVVSSLTTLCEREQVQPDTLSEHPEHLDAMRCLLAAQQPIEKEYAGPEYFFPQHIPQPHGVIAQRMTHEHAESLAPHFRWVIPLLDSIPVCAVIENGVAVSLCFSSRTTPQADEAGVSTAEGHRGKGYAPMAVAAWANAVRTLGRVPLYGTTWDNAASRRVAAKLGLIQFGALLSIG